LATAVSAVSESSLPLAQQQPPPLTAADYSSAVADAGCPYPGTGTAGH